MNKLALNIVVGLFVFTIFCLQPSSCDAQKIESPFNSLELDLDKETKSYSFFVAGHLYGAVFPASTILAARDMINADDASFFVCLGDLCGTGDLTSLALFKKGFASKVAIPVFNAVGNHDVVDRLLYEKIFGKTYFDFCYGNDLFIFLDSELNEWEIKGKQLEFFQNVIKDCIRDPKIKKVFIFSHKLIWLQHNSDYQVVYDNLNDRFRHRPNSYNFKENLEPYLIELSLNNKTIYWFSGDIGCPWSYTLFYEKDPKFSITYIATGIGETMQDAIIKVNVSNNDEVTFTPISLTGQKLKPLEHYGVNYWEKRFPPKNYIQRLIRKILRITSHRYFLAGMLGGMFFLSFFLFSYKHIRKIRITK